MCKSINCFWEISFLCVIHKVNNIVVQIVEALIMNVKYKYTFVKNCNITLKRNRQKTKIKYVYKYKVNVTFLTFQYPFTTFAMYLFYSLIVLRKGKNETKRNETEKKKVSNKSS